MNTKFTNGTLVSALAVLSATGAAASAESIIPSLDVEDIVVTANRRETNIQDVGASIDVLSELALQQGQYSFALDALQTLPGVSVSQNSSFGGVASVRLRGAAGDQTMILIDGVQMNDASAPGGAYDFASLDPFDLDRIEVLKGPQSVLYGSDAMGGVVHFITKSGEDGFGLNGFLETGSYHTLRSGATVRGGDKDLHYRLSAGFNRTDGISAAEANDGNSERDGFRSLTVSGRLGAQITDTGKLQILGRYSDNRNEFDNFFPADSDEVSTGEEASVSGKYSFNLVDNFRNTLSVDYSQISRDSFSSGVEGFGSEGERLAFDWLGIADLTQDVSVTMGLNHEKTSIKGQSADDKTITGVFADLGYSKDGFNVTAGLRRDDHEAFGGVTTGRITSSYQFADTGTKIFGSWGEGFKAPSIFQLTYICGFCGLTAPSVDLSPEETTAWDIGLDQEFMDGAGSLSVAAFHQKSSGLIIFDFAQGYTNLARSRATGIEAAVDLELSDSLIVSSSYTYTKAVDRDADTALIRQPKHQAFTSLSWQANDALSLRLDGTYFGEMTDFGGTVVPDWARFDVKADYEINESLSLFGRIENLFDRQYQQLIGYGTPGLSGYIGIRVGY